MLDYADPESAWPDRVSHRLGIRAGLPASAAGKPHDPSGMAIRNGHQ